MLVATLVLASAVAAPDSPLAVPLARIRNGRGSVGEIEQIAQSPAGLAGISASEAHQAIELLARGDTRRRRELAIVNLLAALSPADRGQCLRLIDGGADDHDLAHLLSDDIDDRALNQRARELIDEARPLMASSERIVLSDIDDTVKPFKDPAVRGRVFPGARALFRALDLGADGLGIEGDVHFVTARDGVVVGVDRDLRATGIRYSSAAFASPLSGAASLFGANDGILEDKVANIGRLLDRNPGRQAIVIGDSTQADPQVFGRLLEERGDRIELALIHRVRGYPIEASIATLPKVLLFDTYADAARELQRRGLISEAQLADVLADR
ncbi:MAG: DUF2183 domain-containing protein [Deltaproteobacteria bacterium]|nr:DUF2183 domain-containing protein [Deltaproteobacteria bacterium]